MVPEKWHSTVAKPPEGGTNFRKLPPSASKKKTHPFDMVPWEPWSFVMTLSSAPAYRQLLSGY